MTPDDANENDSAEEAMPGIDFSTFILSLSHSALVHLGDAPDPESKSRRASLPLARQSIDLIALIESKTRGNLTGEEERLITQVLTDLRLRYVELDKGQGT